MGRTALGGRGREDLEGGGRVGGMGLAPAALQQHAQQSMTSLASYSSVRADRHLNLWGT